MMRNSYLSVLTLTAVLFSTAAKSGVVTSLADNGPGSLRDTIAAASFGDTITFSVTGTIVLTNGELLIDKALDIEGPGAANLMIQRSMDIGTPAFRIFDCVQPAVISGVTI